MVHAHEELTGVLSWGTLAVFLLLSIGDAPKVMAAVTSRRDLVNANDLTQVIRAEVRAGIQAEYGKQMETMTALTKQQQESQFNELHADLRVLLSSYENQVQGQGHSSLSTLRTLTETIGNVTSSLATCSQSRGGPRVMPIAGTCLDLLNVGHKASGVYTITPRGWGPIKVYCDMTTDGGGWMVFQRRTNDSIDFYREWLEYANGFGDKEASYWLGLRPLHHVTHIDQHELRVNLEDFEGQTRYAKYNFLAVSSEFTKFRLDLGSYSGNAGDALAHSRDHRFSTKDRDNDNHPHEHCAVRYSGAWWYNSCYHANLNGRYLEGEHRRNRGITWNMWLGNTYSLKHTTMMIRPKGFHG